MTTISGGVPSSNAGSLGLAASVRPSPAPVSPPVGSGSPSGPSQAATASSATSAAAAQPRHSEALAAAQQALEAQSQEQQKAIQAKAQESLKEMQQRLAEAIERLNEQMQQNQTKLGFVVDASTDTLIVKVMNKETGEVVRQIPGEAVIKIAQSIEAMKGMFFDQEL
jgi:flagellar protein FlaG